MYGAILHCFAFCFVLCRDVLCCVVLCIFCAILFLFLLCSCSVFCCCCCCVLLFCVLLSVAVLCCTFFGVLCCALLCYCLVPMCCCAVLRFFVSCSVLCVLCLMCLLCSKFLSLAVYQWGVAAVATNGCRSHLPRASGWWLPPPTTTNACHYPRARGSDACLSPLACIGLPPLSPIAASRRAPVLGFRSCHYCLHACICTCACVYV